MFSTLETLVVAILRNHLLLASTACTTQSGTAYGFGLSLFYTHMPKLQL
jgi:hypothetical protein